MYYSCQAEHIIVVNNEMSLSEIFHSVVYKNMYWYMSADLKEVATLPRGVSRKQVK